MSLGAEGRLHVCVSTCVGRQLCCGSVWVSVGLFLCALCVSPSVYVTGLSGGGSGSVGG